MGNTLSVIVTPKGEILLNEEALSGILSASQIKYLEAILLTHVRLCKAAGKSPNYKGTAHHEHVSKKHANKTEVLGLLWAVHGGKIALLEISEGNVLLEKLFVEVSLYHHEEAGTEYKCCIYNDDSYGEPAKLTIEKFSAVGEALAKGVKTRYFKDYYAAKKTLLGRSREEWLRVAECHTRLLLYDGPFISIKAPFSAVGTFIRNISKKNIFEKNPISLQIIVNNIYL